MLGTAVVGAVIEMVQHTRWGELHIWLRLKQLVLYKQKSTLWYPSSKTFYDPVCYNQDCATLLLS